MVGPLSCVSEQSFFLGGGGEGGVNEPQRLIVTWWILGLDRFFFFNKSHTIYELPNKFSV